MILDKIKKEEAQKNSGMTCSFTLAFFGKMTRLSATITDPAKVAKIGPVQTALLEGQLKAMQAYDEILLARIQLLK